jgi:hypothetical protein
MGGPIVETHVRLGLDDPPDPEAFRRLPDEELPQEEGSYLEGGAIIEAATDSLHGSPDIRMPRFLDPEACT